jgi:hypothetical protein
MKKEEKEPKVKDAEITEDGCIVIDLGVKLYPHTTKVLFTPDVLLRLAKDYGDIPPQDSNDFPGIPVVDLDGVYDEDDEEGEGDANEEKEEG